MLPAPGARTCSDTCPRTGGLDSWSLLVATLPPRPPRSDCWPGAGSQAALPPLPALQMVSVAVTTYQVTIVTHDTDSNGQNMVRMVTLAAPLLRGDLHLVNINNLDTMLPAETATSAARSTPKLVKYTLCFALLKSYIL